MSNDPIISICVTAFQHEEFIEDCIYSIVSQEINSCIEVIIGVQPFDNTDRTIDKVYNMYARYPELIKIVLLPSNVKHIYMNGKKTGRANFLHTFSYARGRYVCYLDGDDFYDRSDKLKKQFKFLESHPQHVVATHAIVSQSDNRDRAVYWKHHQDGFTLDNICGGLYFHLSSCMYRNIFKGNFPFDFTLPGTGDLYLLMQYLKHGYGFYMPILGSRYRIHENGLYSGVSNKVKRKRMVRNLTVYANTGHFPKHAEKLLSRAKKINLVREYDIYRAKNKHIATLCFLLKNWPFALTKLKNRFRRIIRRLLVL